MTDISQTEWEALGTELFGEDKSKWKFHCPACHREMSIEDAQRDFPELKGKGWSPTEECIGRYTDKVDCDWAAYGLFCGPVFVIADEDRKRIPIFDFAGRPYTHANKDGQNEGGLKEVAKEAEHGLG